MTQPVTPQVWPEDAQPTPPPLPRPAPPKPERAALPLLLAAGLSVLAHALTTGTHGQFGLNVALWVAAFVGAVVWALRQKHLPPTREGLTLLGAALAFAALLTLRGPSPLFAFLAVLALLLTLVLEACWLEQSGVQYVLIFPAKKLSNLGTNEPITINSSIWIGFYGGVCRSEIFHVPYTATFLASVVFYLFPNFKGKKQTRMTGYRSFGQYIIQQQMPDCSYFSHKGSVQ